MHIVRKRTKRIEASVQIQAETVCGQVTEEELVAWLREAVDHYHRFRSGFVGLAAAGRMKKPVIKHIE